MVRYKHFYDKLFELNWEFSAQEEPTVKAVKSAKALAEPEKIPAKPAKEPSKSEKKPEEPTKESVEPTKESVEPTKESVEPTKESVEPTKESVEPTKKISGKTDRRIKMEIDKGKFVRARFSFMGFLMAETLRK
ncbi:MAG: hypothetical protein HFG47_07335 [Lachnospiraceae bacterium]|nr:hypothetical protein [Lachnospiraceae bacterium]